MRPIIVVNDATTHGGKVLKGAPDTFIDDLIVARHGDPVSCPIHGLSTIESHDRSVLVDDLPVARDGDKTTCGATLIASQNNTFIY
jgi:uncharacterized Zn-binding protein involved in type VI secretion